MRNGFHVAVGVAAMIEVPQKTAVLGKEVTTVVTGL